METEAERRWEAAEAREVTGPKKGVPRLNDRQRPPDWWDLGQAASAFGALLTVLSAITGNKKLASAAGTASAVGALISFGAAPPECPKCRAARMQRNELGFRCPQCGLTEVHATA